MTETEILFDLLKKGVSPVQVVDGCRERLAAAGFAELSYSKPWKLEKNGKYYVNHHDTSLLQGQRHHRSALRRRIRIFHACASSLRRRLQQTDMRSLMLRSTEEQS